MPAETPCSTAGQRPREIEDSSSHNPYGAITTINRRSAYDCGMNNIPERSESHARPGRTARLAARRSLTICAILAVLQVVPGPRSGNPPLDPGSSLNDRIPSSAEPSALLQRACANCHSNQTVWPWYSKLAPASWLIARDVNTARQYMNLSEWPSDPFEAVGLLKSSCAQVSTGNMPPPAYRLMHPEARLSERDVQAFCKWTESAIPSLEARYAQPVRASEVPAER